MKRTLTYLHMTISGVFYAMGVCLCLGLFALIFLLASTHANSNMLVQIKHVLSTTFVASEASEFEHEPASTVVKQFSISQRQVPDDYAIIQVSDAQTLQQAVARAHQNNGKTAIYLSPGVYRMPRVLKFTVDKVMLLSTSSNPYDTVIQGLGMMHTERVNNLIEVRASDFVLDGISLKDAPNHLLQIAAENNANRPIIRNCILQDSYEQLLKVSYDQLKRPNNISHEGLVEHCIFQYTRGIAPYYYTGGIDALGAKGWRVENNIFKDIASPAKSIAQHGVHFWVNSSDNIVRNNIFIDNDRAIGFGMKLKKHIDDTLDYYSKGGLIEGNVIYHSDNRDPFADTGIVLEASPATVVKNNYVLLQHSYPRAIEYRFKESKDILIEGNFVNRAIAARDGGSAQLVDNHYELDPLAFFEQLQAKMREQNIQDLSKPLEQGR